MKVKFGNIIWATTFVLLIYVSTYITLNNKLNKTNDKLNIFNEMPEMHIDKRLAVDTSVDTNSQEVGHIAFLKVHKTASSTAQNVFLRFGDARNLTFVLPHTKGESGWLNVISYTNSVTSENIVPAPASYHFDLLCCHVIYNRKQFESILPKDTVYIGIVREPLSRFQSAVKYFSPKFILSIPNKSPLSVYAENPLEFEPEDPKMSQTNNRMAVEFGFPSELFPGKSLNGSQTEIDSYISQLNREFHFIIISERFDESMVYMRRLLNWSIKDVLYLDKNIGVQPKNPKKILPEYSKAKIREFLYLDTALYKFAVDRFDVQIANEGEDFTDEVSHFQNVREQVKQFCGNAEAKQEVFESSKWHQKFSLTKSDCNMYQAHEKELIQKHRFRLYGTFDN